VALVLCAGGGVAAWLLLGDGDRGGAETPAAAVQEFLEAVYRERDPAGAAALVCSEARDQAALATKIDELRAYEETQANPRFSWSDPAVVEETGQLTVVSVTITLITDDEKTSEQTLHVSVLDKQARGWWVCDVETAPEPGPTPTPTGAPEETGAAGDGE
jgi:hypothetical protein